MKTKYFKSMLAIILALLVTLPVATPTAFATSFTKSKPQISVKSASYKSIKISWKKLSGAKGYKVYRKTSKNGKYKLIKTTTKLSYTNTSLTCGKKYYYRVKAYKKGAYSKYSSVKYTYPKLSTPSIKSVTTTYTTATVSFGKISGATAYYIHCKPYGGSYKYVGKTNSKTFSYRVTGLKNASKYYFKVYAARKVGTKNVYSKASSYKYAKTLVYVAPKPVGFGGATLHMATNGHYMFSKDYGNFERRINDFERKYNCYIEIDDYGFGTFNNDIAAAYTNGTSYDIVYLHGSMFIDGVKRGIYTNLKNYLTASATPKNGGIDAYKTSYFDYNGGKYAACYYKSCFPYIIYYNKALCAELGYTGTRDPRYMAEHGDWSFDKIKEMGIAVNNLSNGKKLLSNSFATRVINLACGAPVTIKRSDGKYYENVSSPKFIAGLELMQSFFIGANVIAESPDIESNQYKSFLKGNTYMFTEESYKMLYLTREVANNTTAFNRQKSQIGIVEVPLPKINDQKAYPTGWFTGFACGKGGNPKATALWAEFCSTYKDSILDTEDFTSTDKAYVDSLLDGNISFEVANFSNSGGTALSYASGAVNSAIHGTNATTAANNAKPNITSSIYSTMGY